MNSLRAVRYFLWGLVVLAAIGFGIVASNIVRGADDEPAGAEANIGVPFVEEPASAAVSIGAPFALVTHDNEPITEAHLSGHPSLMFFGFTFCPDVCPTALAEVTGWLAELGPGAEDLVVYFVTVDPARDQPSQLAEYLSAFDPDIVGITGQIDDVHAMLDGYRVFYDRYDAEGVGYLMDHYASFYMLDRSGNFAGSIAFNELGDEALRLIRRLVAGR